MFYRIRFKAAPEEFVFEVKSFVLVRDVIQTVRDNFKIYKDELVVYDENCKRLHDTDQVDSGRTYVVKRIPSNRILYRRKLKL